MGANPTINLNDNLPAAPVGEQNIQWQSTPSVHTPLIANVSAYIPTPSANGPLFTADGDSISGYTTVGTITAGTASSGYSPHDLQKTIFASPNGAAYKSTGLTSLAGMVIEFDIASDTTNGLCDFYFGANSSGAGPVFRLDGRASDLSGITASVNFASVPTVPSPGDVLTGDTWYHVRIVINGAGTYATWSINGVVKAQVAITLNGDYISFFGDGGANGGRFANLQIYKS